MAFGGESLTEERNTLLETTSYEVIKQHGEIIGQPPTGLYFNKLMSLTYTELKEKRGINIKLPHCWYRYGDEVVRYLMPREVQWNHETPIHTSVSWKGEAPRYEDVTVNQIREVVAQNTEKYKDLTKEELVDDVYAIAPFDFQRNFRQLRLNIEKYNSAKIEIANYKEAVLLPSLKRTIDSYPEKEFPKEVAERIYNYAELMNILLEISAFNKEIGLELTEDIWFYFSYFLRVHNGCYENVPKDTVEYWKNQLEDQTYKFDRIFSDILVYISNKQSLKLEGNLLKILNDRKHEKEEEFNFIEEFWKD